MSRRPNILFLMADQHNAKCLGHSGNEVFSVVQTPHLDSLAARGVRCDSAFVQNPICTPSRLCHLTSQYCHNHGYYGLSGPRPPRLPSLFHQFSDAGYRTGAIGKLHLPAGWINLACDYHAEAFHPVPGGLQGYREWLAERTDQPAHNEQHPDGRPDWLPKELDYDSGWAVERAGEFLSTQPAGQPFLLWLTFYKPHQEYSAAPEFWDLYPDPVMPPNADDDPAHRIRPVRQTITGQRQRPPAKYEPQDYESLRRRKLQGYLGNISQMDWAVGQVLAKLDALGLRDDTLIVYTSDHGDFACEHGLLEKAPGIASEAIGRVPQIWSWPGRLPAGESRRQLVESVDLWPTLAHYAGLPDLAMWDGHQLSEILEHDGPAVRDAAFTENPWLKTITTDRWRLTWMPPSLYPDDPVRGELYDRVDDPWQRENLYHNPGYRPVVEALTARLMDWLVTSQHPITAWPVDAHPSYTLRGHSLAMDGTAYPEDGKTAPGQLRAQVEHGSANYL